MAGRWRVCNLTEECLMSLLLHPCKVDPPSIQMSARMEMLYASMKEQDGDIRHETLEGKYLVSISLGMNSIAPLVDLFPFLPSLCSFFPFLSLLFFLPFILSFLFFLLSFCDNA